MHAFLTYFLFFRMRVHRCKKRTVQYFHHIQSASLQTVTHSLHCAKNKQTNGANVCVNRLHVNLRVNPAFKKKHACKMRVHIQRHESNASLSLVCFAQAAYLMNWNGHRRRVYFSSMLCSECQNACACFFYFISSLLSVLSDDKERTAAQKSPPVQQPLPANTQRPTSAPHTSLHHFIMTSAWTVSFLCVTWPK